MKQATLINGTVDLLDTKVTELHTSAPSCTGQATIVMRGQAHLRTRPFHQ